MTKTDDRIAALEAEVAQLHARRADELTRPTPAPVEPPKPGAVVEEGATVTHPVAHNPAFVMPSEAQLHELLSIACRRYPILKAGISKNPRFAVQDEQALFVEYASAFRALGTVSRMPAGEVDEKHYADRWVRVVQDHLQDRSQSVGLLPVVAAVIAHNDVPFMLNTNHMMSSSFGLRNDGVGIMASDAWRHVLTTGTVRDSLPLPLPARTWRAGMVRAG